MLSAGCSARGGESRKELRGSNIFLSLCRILGRRAFRAAAGGWGGGCCRHAALPPPLSAAPRHALSSPFWCLKVSLHVAALAPSAAGGDRGGAGPTAAQPGAPGSGRSHHGPACTGTGAAMQPPCCKRPALVLVQQRLERRQSWDTAVCSSSMRESPQPTPDRHAIKPRARLMAGPCAAPLAASSASLSRQLGWQRARPLPLPSAAAAPAAARPTPPPPPRPAAARRAFLAGSVVKTPLSSSRASPQHPLSHRQDAV